MIDSHIPEPSPAGWRHTRHDVHADARVPLDHRLMAYGVSDVDHHEEQVERELRRVAEQPLRNVLDTVWCRHDHSPLPRLAHRHAEPVGSATVEPRFPPHAHGMDDMAAAIGWGALAASALLVGALIAYHLTPSPDVIALVMALGTGLLIGSVSFELVDEALRTRTVAAVGLFVMIGAAVFTVGDWLLTRGGGADRKDSGGAQADGSALAIVLGSVLDGIPESFVLGLTVLEGGVSAALLAAVVLSNLPEGMSSSSGLRAAHWPERRVLLMWSAVIAVSALSAALGYLVLDPARETGGALVQAFAAGALLAMLATTMLPEAYEREGLLTGPLVVAGFAVSIALSAV
jgi:ZIP family zinc transporter